MIIHSKYYLSFSEYMFRILLLGDSGVGKSSIIMRYSVIKLLILGKFFPRRNNGFNRCGI